MTFDSGCASSGVDGPGENVLFLSPHLDDVIWSCPGDVMRTLAAGGRAVVATVFTASDGGATERARKREDRDAVEAVGAEARHLDLVDAPWRPPWWDTDECGFGDLVCGPLDATLVREVTRALCAVVDDLRPDRIVAPLGVGHHVDHRTVYAAAVESGEVTSVPVEFYEDRPYSFVDGSVAVRLAQLGASDEPVDWNAHWAAFDSARHVRAFLSDPRERQRIVGHVQCFRLAAVRRPMCSVDLDLTPTQLATARIAMSTYGSQLDVFLDDALLARCGTERRWRWG